MNDDEMEAQQCTKQAQSSVAMDASTFAPSSNSHNSSCLHVQMCSNMLHDDEWIKEKCLCLKDFAEKVREEFGGFCDSRSRIGNCDENSYD